MRKKTHTQKQIQQATRARHVFIIYSHHTLQVNRLGSVNMVFVLIRID